MSLLTQISNKVQYVASQTLNDPEAEAYAKQQAQQAEHDKEAKKRSSEAAAKVKAEAKAKEESDAKAQSLADRSEFKASRATSNIASGILTTLFSLLLTAIMLYAGHLAANEAIGYNVPFRLLSFFYGAIFFFIVIPKSLYQRFILKRSLDYFAFLPLSTYVPNGNFEKLFLGGFCYTENEASAVARATVDTLYKTAFDKSQIKTA